MTKLRLSVAMAVYNGEMYLAEQIDSILSMLKEQDELIISYDRSKDMTWTIINKYAKEDKRIKVVVNKQEKGYANNFTNALYHCSGKYIFLADQDDIWLNNKLEKMVNTFEKDPRILVVLCNGILIDENSQVIGKLKKIKKNPILNFITGTYLGCCMAFRRVLIPIVCPYPADHYIGHDLLTGIIGGTYGKVGIVDDVCVYHRIHGNNATEKLSIGAALENRLFFGIHILKILMFKGKRKLHD